MFGKFLFDELFRGIYHDPPIIAGDWAQSGKLDKRTIPCEHMAIRFSFSPDCRPLPLDFARYYRPAFSLRWGGVGTPPAGAIASTHFTGLRTGQWTFSLFRFRECLTSVRIVCLTSDGRVLQWSMTRCKSAGISEFPVIFPVALYPSCVSCPSFASVCGGWFESLSRKFSSLSAPFSLPAPARIVLQTLENQVSADFAYRFSSMQCKALLSCAAGKKAGESESAIFLPLFLLPVGLLHIP